MIYTFKGRPLKQKHLIMIINNGEKPRELQITFHLLQN